MHGLPQCSSQQFAHALAAEQPALAGEKLGQSFMIAASQLECVAIVHVVHANRPQILPVAQHM